MWVTLVIVVAVGEVLGIVSLDTLLEYLPPAADQTTTQGLDTRPQSLGTHPAGFSVSLFW